MSTQSDLLVNKIILEIIIFQLNITVSFVDFKKKSHRCPCLNYNISGCSLWYIIKHLNLSYGEIIISPPIDDFTFQNFALRNLKTKKQEWQQSLPFRIYQHQLLFYCCLLIEKLIFLP